MTCNRRHIPTLIGNLFSVCAWCNRGVIVGGDWYLVPLLRRPDSRYFVSVRTLSQMEFA